MLWEHCGSIRQPRGILSVLALSECPKNIQMEHWGNIKAIKLPEWRAFLVVICDLLSLARHVSMWVCLWARKVSVRDGVSDRVWMLAGFIIDEGILFERILLKM